METKLIELRKKLERVKAKKASLEGERKAILSRLKKEYGISSLSQAKKKLNDLERSVKAKEKRRNSLIQKIDSRLREIEEG